MRKYTRNKARIFDFSLYIFSFDSYLSLLRNCDFHFAPKILSFYSISLLRQIRYQYSLFLFSSRNCFAVMIPFETLNRRVSFNVWLDSWHDFSRHLLQQKLNTRNNICSVVLLQAVLSSYSLTSCIMQALSYKPDLYLWIWIFRRKESHTKVPTSSFALALLNYST